MRLKLMMKFGIDTPKHAKPAAPAGRLLLSSLVGIALCTACLAGTTWAWFTAGVAVPPQRLQAARYEAAVSINGTDQLSENGRYTLKSGENEVTLTASGNASTGYCKIIMSGQAGTYYTPPFPNPGDQNPAAAFTFTVKVPADTEMTVIPTWGTYTGTEVLRGGGLLDLTAPSSGGRNQSEAGPAAG